MLCAGLLGATSASAEIYRTDVPTDLAIEGPGMFLLRQPGTGEYLVTRAGDFRVTADGLLVSAYGDVLQGFGSTTDSTTVDMSLAKGGRWPREWFLNCRITSAGVLELENVPGHWVSSGQILLVTYPGLDARVPRLGPRVHGDAFELPEGLQDEVELWQFRPGLAPVGMLKSGYLEVADEITLTPLSAPALTQESQLVYRTGRMTDLAIQGPGWFLLRDPWTQRAAVTRAGVFRLDPEGYLITPRGFRLQAEPLPGGPAATWPEDHPRFCDVQIPSAWGALDELNPNETTVRSFTINEDGTLELSSSDNSSSNPMRLPLAVVPNPELLQNRGFGIRGVPDLSALIIGLPASKSPSLGRLQLGALDPREIPVALRALYPRIRNFTQGAVRRSSGITDLAISGAGFFVVRDQVTSERLATRAGCFTITEDGFFELPGGYRLQGQVHSHPVFGTLTDLRAVDSWRPDGMAAPPGAVARFDSIGYEGEIQNVWSDQTSQEIGRIRLQEFRNPEALTVRVTDPCGIMAEGVMEDWGEIDPAALVLNGALFAGYAEALPQRLDAGAPGRNGLGLIHSQALELPAPAAGVVLPKFTGGPAYRLDTGLVPMGFFPGLEWSTDLVHWQWLSGPTYLASHGLIVMDPTAASGSAGTEGVGGTACFFRTVNAVPPAWGLEPFEVQFLEGPTGWQRTHSRDRFAYASSTPGEKAPPLRVPVTHRAANAEWR